MTLAEALRPRQGTWAKVATRGCGGQRCAGCGETATSGWAFYETAVLSTAFLCDACVEMIVEDES